MYLQTCTHGDRHSRRAEQALPTQWITSYLEESQSRRSYTNLLEMFTRFDQDLGLLCLFGDVAHLSSSNSTLKSATGMVNIITLFPTLSRHYRRNGLLPTWRHPSHGDPLRICRKCSPVFTECSHKLEVL